MVNRPPTPLAFFQELWPTDNSWHIVVMNKKYLKMEGYDNRWFPCTKEGILKAIKYAEQIQPDTYFTVCAHSKREGSKRGANKSARLLPCLFADIDHGKPHKTNNYPSTEKVDNFLSTLPFEPSIIIKTLGGYHVYWLFDEPVDAQENSDLCESWQEYMRENLRKEGFDLDYTGDISRVLRFPGTIQDRSSVIKFKLFKPSRRYKPEQFIKFLPKRTRKPKTNKKKQSKTSSNLLTQVTAEPPPKIKHLTNQRGCFCPNRQIGLFQNFLI